MDSETIMGCLWVTSWLALMYELWAWGTESDA
jgi:hypothetical protein